MKTNYFVVEFKVISIEFNRNVEDLFNVDDSVRVRFLGDSIFINRAEEDAESIDQNDDEIVHEKKKQTAYTARDSNVERFLRIALGTNRDDEARTSNYNAMNKEDEKSRRPSTTKSFGMSKWKIATTQNNIIWRFTKHSIHYDVMRNNEVLATATQLITVNFANQLSREDFKSHEDSMTLKLFKPHNQVYAGNITVRLRISKGDQNLHEHFNTLFGIQKNLIT